MKPRPSILFVATLVLLSLTAGDSNAASVTLNWNANSESDLAGYRVYYGTQSRVYGAPVNVGLATSHQLGDLAAGVRYYLAVTAVDASGNESAPSAECEITTPVTVGAAPPKDAESDLVGYAGGLAVDFGSSGVWWNYLSLWTQLTPADPQKLAVYSGKLVGDFGSQGLWQHVSGKIWTQLTPADADNSGTTMMGYGTGLTVDFGGLGLWWINNNAWTPLTGSNPEKLATYSDKLVGDFGSQGLWQHVSGANWIQLTPADADGSGNTLVAYGTGLAVDFGGLGLWWFNGGTWSPLTYANPDRIEVYIGKLVGDFGSQGLWQHTSGENWTLLTPADADNSGNPLVAYGSGLAVDFSGLGIWHYDGSAWSQLTASNPEWLAIGADKLAGDFGSLGVWQNQGGAAWTLLNP
jgi:hypothetical protein